MATVDSCPCDAATSGVKADEGAHASWHEYLYWALPLALLPLAFSLGQHDDDTLARFRRTLADAPPEVRLRVELTEQLPNATLDDVLAVLPDQRIAGSLLPRPTTLHWLFAIASAIGFLAFSMRLFRSGDTSPHTLIGVGLFTATAGVVMLLTIEGWLAPTSHDVLESEANFPLSLSAYILGVGLFEELAKALPLLWRAKHAGPLRWRTACLWGLASGIGFGVAEGVYYSERVYNGLATADAYLVRFVSCVALHAVWTASVALGIVKAGSALHDTREPAVYAAAMLKVLAIPVALHGIYDVLLQYQFHAAGLAVALASFGWLAWQIESARSEESPRHVELGGELT